MKCVAEVAGAKLQSKNQDYQWRGHTHTQPWEESNTWWEFCLSGDFESPSLELCGGIVVERTKNKLQGKHVYIHGAIPWTKDYKGVQG